MLTMIGILKVIGIVLLCVTGAVALLLLLVLFMPVRYRIKGEFEKNIPLGQMTAVWLFGALGFKASYDTENGANAYVSAFGIRIFDLLKDREESGTKAAERPSEVRTEEVKETIVKETIVKETKAEETEAKETKAGETEAKESKAEERTKAASWRAYFYRIKEKTEDKLRRVSEETAERLREIQDSVKSLYGSIREKTDKAESLWSLYKDARYREAVSMAKRLLGTILREIRPRRGHGRLLLGTGDPYGTAQAMQAAAFLYPLYAETIEIIPEFDRQVFEVRADIRGRIHIAVLLFCAGRIFFSKKLRKMYHEAKRIVNSDNSDNRRMTWEKEMTE